MCDLGCKVHLMHDADVVDMKEAECTNEYPDKWTYLKKKIVLY